MRAPTEILGVRYFLLGVIFTRTNTRVESSHQGTPQNKNKSFSLSFPDCQSLWAGSAYITLGVASAFGPDHYILPHITQRIQAASAFQAGPHFISYPGAVPTLSHLQHAECCHTMFGEFDPIESSDRRLKHPGLCLVECRRPMFGGFRRFN